MAVGNKTFLKKLGEAMAHMNSAIAALERAIAAPGSTSRHTIDSQANKIWSAYRQIHDLRVDSGGRSAWERVGSPGAKYNKPTSRRKTSRRAR